MIGCRSVDMWEMAGVKYSGMDKKNLERMCELRSFKDDLKLLAVQPEWEIFTYYSGII